MVATFSQLHHYIEKSCFTFSFTYNAIDCIDVFFQEFFVPSNLHFCHSTVDVGFYFGKQRSFHVRFYTPKKKWTQHFVQLLDNFVLVTFFLRALAFEPFVEHLRVAENIRKEKIEQSPEFVEIILEGSTGYEEPIFRVKQPDDLRQRTVFVLYSMSLVHHNILPSELLELGLFTHHHFKRGD